MRYKRARHCEVRSNLSSFMWKFITYNYNLRDEIVSCLAMTLGLAMTKYTYRS